MFLYSTAAHLKMGEIGPSVLVHTLRPVVGSPRNIRRRCTACSVTGRKTEAVIAVDFEGLLNYSVRLI